MVTGFLVGASFAVVVTFVAEQSAPGPIGWVARLAQSPGVAYVALLDSLTDVYPPELARMGPRANIVFYGVSGAILVRFFNRKRRRAMVGPG